MKINLNTVMYHYVRPIQKSKYPKIKGLEFKKFVKQLDFLEQNFTIINPFDFLDHVLNRKKLNVPNPCLLTFDDGLKDHLQYVLPELQKRGLSGCFFVPTASLQKLELLDVHAIHFILESGHSVRDLLGLTTEICLNFGFDVKISHSGLALNKSNRFDGADVKRLKRLLQYELPLTIRHDVVTNLFEKLVKESASELAQKLYMTVEDLQYMVLQGMLIGSHSHTHTWLEYQTLPNQLAEISRSVSFLQKIGVMDTNWLFAYPYGSYNSETIDLLESLGCKAAFTTKVGFSCLGSENLLALSRFDTNDYPQE
jgi:peptidoglycan/xylan/chitin deacetylase (PgdA/CDA1 family)